MDQCPGKSKRNPQSVGQPDAHTQFDVLDARSGRRYWRSLEEYARTDEFRKTIQREFPSGASEWLADDVSRRNFLKLMGASLALAGLAGTGCSRGPEQTIVPYVYPPEEVVYGRPLFYATAMPFDGYAKGVLVEQHEGRPTKIEGNPDHPSNVGGTDVWMQASILGLYDPDRSQSPLKQGYGSSWSAFLADFNQVVEAFGGAQSVRLAVLSGTVTSPTLAWQMQQLRQAFPNLRWYQYEALPRDNVRNGAKLAFGRIVNPVYDFSKAQRILSLDSNFLIDEPGSLRYARQFIHNRRVRFRNGQATQGKMVSQTGRFPDATAEIPTPQQMVRLYTLESTPTITGASSDHRLPLAASQVEAFARAVANAVGEPVLSAPKSHLPDAVNGWIDAVTKDLKEYRGRSLVIAGFQQPPVVHALAHAINARLGNVGQTVYYTDPVEAEPTEQVQSLAALTQAMTAGEVDVLVMLGASPALTAPADLEFESALDRFANSRGRGNDGTPVQRVAIRLGLYEDRSSYYCRWHIPQSHYLESWSDIRGHDGTVTIMQPLIAPLYASVNAHEFLAAIMGQTLSSAHEILRSFWQQNYQKTGNPNGLDFEPWWETALHDGRVQQTAAPAVSVPLSASGQWPVSSQAPSADSLELCFRPDPSIWDGQYANNGWLQELPKPITQLTWDNAALISPALAVRLGLGASDRPGSADQHEVELSFQGRTLRMPLLVVPGQPENSVTVHTGYFGTRGTGQVADGAGFDVYRLRTTTAMWSGTGLKLTSTGGWHDLARTQGSQMMWGRPIVAVEPIDNLRQRLGLGVGTGPSTGRTIHLPVHGEGEPKNPEFHPSLYPEWGDKSYMGWYQGYKWGMVVDQTACIGCNACVVACQSENNSPVVGKEQVLRGRAMHWIRIDAYFSTESGYPTALDNPQATFQPMFCQHCEKAPCEYVCPVGATTHSAEGLNEMTYNRCVGTRYCSNNCPYKVRRFNFFQYADTTTPSLKLLRNPEVTVRSRGVMEKCTYCLQRIDHARIDAKERWVNLKTQTGQAPTRRSAHPGNEPLPPIDVITACQQACPTEALVFGDMNDLDTLVHRMKQTDPYRQLNYRVLEELDTAPRTSYLERVINPNAQLPVKMPLQGRSEL